MSPSRATRLPRSPYTLCVWAFLCVVGLHAAASDTLARGPWESEVSGPATARVRLLDGGMEAAGAHLVGIEMRLAEGWSTYWRTPGEAGMPLRIDWSRSANLKGAAIAWPAPRQRRMAERDVNVYDGAVILPVWVSATDPSRAVDLRLDLAYGICSEVCIPASASLTLTIPPRRGDAETSPYHALLTGALESVPATASTDAASISGTLLTDGDGATWLIADLPLPWTRGEGLTAFVEGPGGIVFAHPEIVGEGDDRRASLRARLSRGRFAANSRSDLRVTLVQGDESVELRVPVTIAASR